MEQQNFDLHAIARSMSMLWDPLTEAQRELFVSNLSAKRFQQNEIIFKQGDPTSHIFYLLEGKVSISRMTSGGRVQIIRMVEPHRAFGVQPVFTGDVHKQTARAGAETLVTWLPADVAMQLLRENTGFAMVFIERLSQLLDASIEHVIKLTQKHIRGRLAENLLKMKEKYGVEADGQTLMVYLSREDLANMSNMTTSNAIRTLSAFISEGLVALNGRRIQFLNEKELQRVSRIG